MIHILYIYMYWMRLLILSDLFLSILGNFPTVALFSSCFYQVCGVQST